LEFRKGRERFVEGDREES